MFSIPQLIHNEVYKENPYDILLAKNDGNLQLSIHIHKQLRFTLDEL